MSIRTLFTLLVLKLLTLFLNRISSKVKLVFILVLKHYSMISFPKTMRMVIMILERRKTEIAFVAWKMQVVTEDGKRMLARLSCSSNGV